jgi:hypothetical protein
MQVFAMAGVVENTGEIASWVATKQHAAMPVVLLNRYRSVV